MSVIESDRSLRSDKDSGSLFCSDKGEGCAFSVRYNGADLNAFERC